MELAFGWDGGRGAQESHADVTQVATAPAGAQASASGVPRMPVRIRATIEKFDNKLLTVKTEKGDELTFAVTPKTNISGVTARKLTDIKPNDFISVTAMEGTDKKLHATEVHIFPEAMRGAGEGQYPWYKGPGSSVTNGAVAGMVDSTDARRSRFATTTRPLER